MLARGNGGHKVFEEKFVSVPTGSYQFIALLQGRYFRSTNDEIFLPKAQKKHRFETGL